MPVTPAAGVSSNKRRRSSSSYPPLDVNGRGPLDHMFRRHAQSPNQPQSPHQSGGKSIVDLTSSQPGAGGTGASSSQDASTLPSLSQQQIKELNLLQTTHSPLAAPPVVRAVDRGEISAYQATALGTWLELGRTLAAQAEKNMRANQNKQNAYAYANDDDVGIYVDIAESLVLSGVALPQLTPGYETLVAMVRKYGGAPLGHRAISAMRHAHRLQPPTTAPANLLGTVAVDERAWAPVDAAKRAEGRMGVNQNMADEEALLADENDAGLMELMKMRTNDSFAHQNHQHVGGKRKGRGISDEWQALCDHMKFVRCWLEGFCACAMKERRRSMTPSQEKRKKITKESAAKSAMNEKRAAAMALLDEDDSSDSDVEGENFSKKQTTVQAVPREDGIGVIDEAQLHQNMIVHTRIAGRLMWLEHTTNVLGDDLACRAKAACVRREAAGGEAAGRQEADKVLSSSGWRRLLMAGETFKIGAYCIDALLEEAVDVLIMSSTVDHDTTMAEAERLIGRCADAEAAGAAPARVAAGRMQASLLVERIHAAEAAHHVAESLLRSLLESYALDETCARFARFGGGGAHSRSAAAASKNYRRKADGQLANALVARTRARGEEEEEAAHLCIAALDALLPQQRVRVAYAALLLRASLNRAREAAATTVVAAVETSSAQSGCGGGGVVAETLDTMVDGVLLADALRYIAVDANMLMKSIPPPVVVALVCGWVEASLVLGTDTGARDAWDAAESALKAHATDACSHDRMRAIRLMLQL
ncbi:hypothetical protein PPROV_000799200 [Pycnococcus provasolii]|uniref:Uncharacterized protein n=1 Tax=Pycnococcus provasolii TaxID=41880 RepID=A0A830HRF4_9CHLO|nr:hypothetical protein PPROV_000799200 [Pycnococcus provasolii]